MTENMIKKSIELYFIALYDMLYCPHYSVDKRSPLWRSRLYSIDPKACLHNECIRLEVFSQNSSVSRMEAGSGLLACWSLEKKYDVESNNGSQS